MTIAEDGRWQWMQPFPDTVKIEADIIKVTPPWQFYYPLEVPSLPNALAKIDHKEAAVAFVQKYGLLGYSGLGQDPIHLETSKYRPYEGDPLSWFLAQASTVRFVLNLIVMLQNNDERALNDWIMAQAVSIPFKVFDPSAPKEVRIPAHVLAEGQEVVHMHYSEEGPPCETYNFGIDWALSLIAFLVNVNTYGFRRRLVHYYTKKRLVPGLSARALIEAIWYMVGQAALSLPKSKLPVIRLCEECGTPFLVTDRRQRFCPGDGFSRGSLCGARYRMRRSRQNRQERRNRNGQEAPRSR